MAKINLALRKTPDEVGLSGNLWDGKTLSAHIKKSHGVSLGTRQCQRMFRHLEFRLRKPQPMIAHADPELLKKHKKTKKAVA
jgi:transposase